MQAPAPRNPRASVRAGSTRPPSPARPAAAPRARRRARTALAPASSAGPAARPRPRGSAPATGRPRPRATRKSMPRARARSATAGCPAGRAQPVARRRAATVLDLAPGWCGRRPRGAARPAGRPGPRRCRTLQRTPDGDRRDPQGHAHARAPPRAGPGRCRPGRGRGRRARRRRRGRPRPGCRSTRSSRRCGLRAAAGTAGPRSTVSPTTAVPARSACCTPRRAERVQASALQPAVLPSTAQRWACAGPATASAAASVSSRVVWPLTSAGSRTPAAGTTRSARPARSAAGPTSAMRSPTTSTPPSASGGPVMGQTTGARYRTAGTAPESASSHRTGLPTTGVHGARNQEAPGAHL